MIGAPDPETEKKVSELAENAGKWFQTHLLYKVSGPVSSKTTHSVLTYLLTEEQPYALLATGGYEKEIQLGSDTISTKDKGVIMLSDLRFALILGREDGDEIVSIPLHEIDSIECGKQKIIGQNKPFVIRSENATLSMDIRIKVGIRELLKEYIDTHQAESKDGPQIPFSHEKIPKEVVYVCTECRSEIPQKATRCPNCGHNPAESRKGPLWHGTGLALSFSPIGWAMMAKGAVDELSAHQSVGEEVAVNPSELEDDVVTESEKGESSFLEQLERLSELHDSGKLTDEEFENMKKRLSE